MGRRSWSRSRSVCGRGCLAGMRKAGCVRSHSTWGAALVAGPRDRLLCVLLTCYECLGTGCSWDCAGDLRVCGICTRGLSVKQEHLIQPGPETCPWVVTPAHPSPQHPVPGTGPGVGRGASWICWFAGTGKAFGARKWALGPGHGRSDDPTGRGESRRGGSTSGGVGVQEWILGSVSQRRYGEMMEVAA